MGNLPETTPQTSSPSFSQILKSDIKLSHHETTSLQTVGKWLFMLAHVILVSKIHFSSRPSHMVSAWPCFIFLDSGWIMAYLEYNSDSNKLDLGIFLGAFLLLVVGKLLI